MKPRKDEIRDLARKAEERARGLTPAPGALPAVPAPEVFEIACLCGQLLKIRSAHAGKRCACPSCGRKFQVTLKEDQGRRIPVPVYVTDAAASAPTGETFIADADEPATGPPEELLFPCVGCSKKILAKRAVYGKRVRCTACGARMIVDVVYDETLDAHLVRPLPVSDPPSGMTSTNIQLP
jgi:DNA-directed RNA polymerase subunit RPC12/RpoP